MSQITSNRPDIIYSGHPTANGSAQTVATVATGEIWTMTYMNFTNTAASAYTVSVSINNGGGGTDIYVLYSVSIPPYGSGTNTVDWNGNLPLPANTTIKVTISTGTTPIDINIGGIKSTYA